MDTRRLVLFVIFSMSILMLWDAWQTKHSPANVPMAASTTVNTVAAPGVIDSSVDAGYALKSGENIAVTTDLYKINIKDI